MNKQHAIISLVFLLLFTWSLYGQDAKNTQLQHSLGIWLGSEQGYFKDINFSPLNYKLSGFVPDLNYRPESGKNHLTYGQIQFASGNIRTNASEFLAEGYGIE